ncbi:unnamed protein product [Brachionus calyciflorus]|uniref:Uncharacterized protein n=1 Tax=Brachionus calyciflorus TaxID=104777 RepID=A0A813M2T5_9BILA|nr:unnamed protein product [Brachionus calyciflorus]
MKKKISSEIKKIILENIESSTSHGFPNIVRNESFILKLMWTLCLLVSSGYCAYCLTKSFQDYFSYETDTQMKFKRVSQIEFPTVTFCNKFAADLNKGNWLSELAKYGYKELKLSLSDLTKFNEFFKEIDYNFKYESLKFKDNFNLVGFDIDKMLLNCNFNFKECNSSNFKFFLSSIFGFCYQFNADKTNIRKVSSPGKQAGLSLELFIGYPNKDYDLYKSYGAHLFIHNSSTIPSSEFDGISLSTGHETDIIVSKTFFQKLSKPYSDCVKDLNSTESFGSEVYKETIKIFGQYEQKVCINLCFHKSVFERCGCYYPDQKIIKNISQACDHSFGFKCYLDFAASFGESKISSECIDKCPEQCQSVKYNLQFSNANFPTPSYADFFIAYDSEINNNLRSFYSYSNVKESTLAVNVYFDDIGYTLVEEKASKTLEQLVADIGGFLGLCIGISILSIAEIFDSILKIILLFFQKKNDSIVKKHLKNFN